MHHIPRKRFGQHFLADQAVLAHIVEAIDPRAGQNLVEIGPGAGALTRLLLARHCPLQAVEIDRDLCAQLRARYASQGLVLHEADVLEFDLRALGAAPRIVGNLPYNISTPLLFRISAELTDVVDCHFMLQEEVVDRLAAHPSTAAYGRLTVMMQAKFDVEKLFTVLPEAFRPPPKVHSAVVRLTPRSDGGVRLEDPALFSDLVRDAFSQRRKMLRNALGEALTEVELQDLAVNPRQRPENLAVDDYVRLANFLARREGGAAFKRADAG